MQYDEPLQRASHQIYLAQQLTLVNSFPMATPDLQHVHEAIAHLRRLTELFQKRRAQLASEAGLTEQQWEVLEQISSEHFMPSMFAKKRESSAAAVSKIIRQLVDKGLVTVSLAEQDARQRRYELTGKGDQVIASLRQSRQEAIDKVWMHQDEGALRSFNELAGNLSKELEALLRA